ncbi:hypothetical protein EYF80_023492 [Liparis tanakae]|uniref:Uncharacterized protein n=1 Tax=Liparis tanakae TaxID=230148 RepID=A0A4Z2HKB6_9TELE|nr:hypothetical protein EYF80_023492 [Liparis tanakae]
MTLGLASGVTRYPPTKIRGSITGCHGNVNHPCRCICVYGDSSARVYVCVPAARRGLAPVMLLSCTGSLQPEWLRQLSEPRCSHLPYSDSSQQLFVLFVSS